MTGPRMLILFGVLAVAACGGRDRDVVLHDLRSNQRSPEEFSILPVKPLQEPASYSELPTPTPGSANLTDPTPKADAITALGGRTSGRTSGGDAALLRQAGRYGTDANIRADLAAKDLELRKSKSRFNWSIVPRDDYRRAYRRYVLDPYAEMRRFQRAGVPVPSAPPEDK